MNLCERIRSGRRAVVGVGSALVDILAHAPEEFIAGCGAIKGGMKLVDHAELEAALKRLDTPPQVVPGGSACNTVAGIGRLGGAARFVGKCGNGRMGDLFENHLRRQGVVPQLLRSDSPTGRVMSIITPDAQRSMLTFLGASAEARPEEFSAHFFEQAAIVHVEGYLLFNPELITAVLTRAKAAGAAVSLDLASFNVVAENRSLLRELVREQVDILLANEDEACAYTGHSDWRAALAGLQADAPLAVLKVGPRGSYISCEGRVAAVAAEGDGRAVDTTGAGDLWAAGFLYGLLKGYPLERCGALGSACGWEVCQVVGTQIPEAGWERIRALC